MYPCCTLQGANMELMLGLSTCGRSLPVILYFRLPCNQMMITITITITKTAQIYVSKCCFLQVCHCIVILSQKHLQYGFCLCQQLFTDCNPEQYDKWANIEERLQTNQSSWQTREKIENVHKKYSNVQKRVGTKLRGANIHRAQQIQCTMQRSKQAKRIQMCKKVQGWCTGGRKRSRQWELWGRSLHWQDVHSHTPTPVHNL